MTTSNVRRLAGIGGALAVLASAPAIAQAAPAAGAPAAAAPQQLTRTQLSQQLDSEFKDLDSNHDGKLTKAEVQAAMTRRVAEAQTEVNQQLKTVFDKIDTNHNGSISLAEFQAQQKLSVDPTKVDARVAQLDANKDGVVSAEEYRNGTLAQFDAADTNHDGVVSAAEAQAAGQGR
jgi:Ca2+-binding EF-hand superfamily protein